jgi:glycolate oxidase FAD binding subunit
MIEVSASDQYLTASADSPLLDIYAALPAGLYPPFPPLELPGGLGGLVSRGGFGQTFFFGAEVLGLSFIAPSGRRVVAGGRTVKNVQGYDLTRPFVGSFGRLGQAESVTLRLRPGLASAHHSRPGTLEDERENLLDSRARFIWQDGETLHAYHFGHVREVQSVIEQFGGTPDAARPDHRPAFAAGMGVGEGGPLRDLRFGWANGGAVPTMPALFGQVAASL